MSNLYNQRQITVEEQIETLRGEGLSFVDEDKARHRLCHISLFRLKPYLKPLRLVGERRFRQGATFEQAYDLYKFDSALRKLVCAELEKIEISIRTQLSYTQTAYSDPFWFADPAHFSDPSFHERFVTKLAKELARDDSEQIEAFRRRYSNPFPPSWIAMEATSFGTLSMIYAKLETKGSNRRRMLASFYGIPDKVMESWLHSIVYIRNICAHHGLLWNRPLVVPPIKAKKLPLPFISREVRNDSVFYSLSVIRYFLQTVNPQSTLSVRLRQLLEHYPNVDATAMGFPEGWEGEPLWR